MSGPIVPNERIVTFDPSVTPQDIIILLADGLPGALTVMMQILMKADVIDPDNELGPIVYLLDLDRLNIWGSRIWMLYKDVCGEDIVKTLAVLRANQLGLIADDPIHYAIDNHGLGLDADQMLMIVKNKLPQFARKP
jgi:hypothetical protein